MDAVKEIEALVEKARAAQKIYETFDQEGVDAVVKAIGIVCYQNAELMSKEAVEETGFGNLKSKIAKHEGGAMAHWGFMKGKKSVGLIEDDPVTCVATYAKPIGVITSITPSTNPTSTLFTNSMSALKCRNAVICAPHPAAKKCTAHAAAIIREALQKAGAPVDLVQCIEEPTIEKTQILMGKVDATIATGGPGMVRSAYSSGKPSFGVGPGNVQVLVDKGYDRNVGELVAGTIANRNRDYGIPCVGEQCIHIHKDDVDRILKAFVEQNAFVIHDEETVDKFRKLLFTDNGNGGHMLNSKMVGKPAPFLAEQIGLKVPDNTNIFILRASGDARTELLCREKLDPVMACLPYETFDEAMEHVLTNLDVEGKGHSAVIYSTDEDHIKTYGEKVPVSRILVNCSSSFSGGGSFAIGLNPTSSLGCGFWGNNSISENLTYLNLMQTTRVARIIPDAHIPTYEELFA